MFGNAVYSNYPLATAKLTWVSFLVTQCSLEPENVKMETV
jgi:hypothetical protein